MGTISAGNARQATLSHRERPEPMADCHSQQKPSPLLSSQDNFVALFALEFPVGSGRGETTPTTTSFPTFPSALPCCHHVLEGFSQGRLLPKSVLSDTLSRKPGVSLLVPISVHRGIYI